MAWASSRRRAELPADWATTIRPRILARDGYRCTAYMRDGGRCPAAATDVDHIGDRHDHGDNNLQSLCRWHHRRKTAAESAVARRAKRPPLRRRPAERHPGLR
ncbi:HNH endonuclease [Streptomyces sp. CB02959]|uniref:HNH endonuclease n=1 Tax=Streptomyces sp. CB02959 TaxID=2020330 RepID=UPI000C26DD10|nr:HNH endonuclease signature motif containing protein [Streptomyces sp. CB02959]PJN40734.1 HNH endonuclease [Streptomyces sp. CB02959]